MPRAPAPESDQGLHIEADGRFDRNYLKGMAGDATHAILCAARDNLRLILSYLTGLLHALIRVRNVFAGERRTDFQSV